MWMSTVSCLKQSGLVVSGSSDGLVRLWRVDVEARSMEQVSALDALSVSVTHLQDFSAIRGQRVNPCRKRGE